MTERKVLRRQNGIANNLKIVISNYYPAFTKEFSVLVNDTRHTVNTTGVMPSKGDLLLTLESGHHKIRIQQTKSLMSFLNKGTIQEFELEYENGNYLLVDYVLNQANRSSHAIKEVSEPFEDPEMESNVPKSREPGAGVKLALKVNNLAWTIGSVAGKIHNAISFKKKS
jgi:hypothetical protein